MSPSLGYAESKWLARYAAMRQTLAELRIEQPSGKGEEYGEDIVLEDEDLTASCGSDELWNMSSDQEHDAGYSSDSVTECPNGRPESAYPYGQKWLGSKCLALTSSKPGMDAEELRQRLSAILTSDMRGLHVRVSS